METTRFDFDGKTYEPVLDKVRLNRQCQIVWDVLLKYPGRWWTLSELALQTGQPEASISARLRDFRKPRFGGHTVKRRRRAPGLFEYQLIQNDEC